MKKNIKKLIGRLTVDPEIKVLDSGATVVNASFVVNNGKESKFFTIAAWGESLAEDFRKYKKGYRIEIIGEPKIGRWIDKQTGEHKKKDIITVKKVFSAPRIEQNIAWVIGRLTANPEIKNYERKTVFNFSVALNEKDQEPEFLKAEYWVNSESASMDFLGQFFKGSQVEIFGHEKESTWTAASGEIKHQKVLVVEHIDLFNFERYKAQEPRHKELGYEMDVPDASCLFPENHLDEVGFEINGL